MNEEVLIPKMKRIDKSKKSIKIPWLNIAIVIFCILLIISSTFLNLNIKHYIIPGTLFSGTELSSDDFVYGIYFIPQIPIIMFLCSFLGKRMSIITIMLYILLGLFAIPVFALGGGLRYLGEFGFGYILAFIPAVIIAGNILENKYSYWNMIKAAVLGVLTIHIIGVLYMIVIALIKHSGGNFMHDWIVAQSGLKIVYDIIISFVLILIGKYLHAGLKFILE